MYKAILVNIVWHWHKDKHIEQRNKVESPEIKFSYLWSIGFWQEYQVYSVGDKSRSSQQCIFVKTGYVCTCAKSLQSCPTLCNAMDHSLPGSSVHGILQARILEGVPCPIRKDLPNPGIEPVSLVSPALAGWFLTTSTT